MMLRESERGKDRKRGKNARVFLKYGKQGEIAKDTEKHLRKGMERAFKHRLGLGSLNVWESHHDMIRPFRLKDHWLTTKPKIDDVVMQGSQKMVKKLNLSYFDGERLPLGLADPNSY